MKEKIMFSHIWTAEESVEKENRVEKKSVDARKYFSPLLREKTGEKMQLELEIPFCALTLPITVFFLHLVLPLAANGRSQKVRNQLLLLPLHLLVLQL